MRISIGDTVAWLLLVRVFAQNNQYLIHDWKLDTYYYVVLIVYSVFILPAIHVHCDATRPNSPDHPVRWRTKRAGATDQMGNIPISRRCTKLVRSARSRVSGIRVKIWSTRNIPLDLVSPRSAWRRVTSIFSHLRRTDTVSNPSINTTRSKRKND